MPARCLGISDRQFRQLLSRTARLVWLTVVGENPARTSPPTDLALDIIRERYTDFGPTLACEKLTDLHDVNLFKETVRPFMVKAGLRVLRKQRAPKIQHPGYRCASCGELIQIEGCVHPWFEKRARACTAPVLVDHATSRWMEIRF